MDGPLRGELAITAAFESVALVLAAVAARFGVHPAPALPGRRRTALVKPALRRAA
ncbi:MAG: hypothetical protein JO050_03470 [Acidimicrobiia bacterium]|nr:hypothetical protein [Acidimicrobiia bacterium]